MKMTSFNFTNIFHQRFSLVKRIVILLSLEMMKMESIAPRMGFEHICVAFQANVLSLTPPRLSIAFTLSTPTWLCGSLPEGWMQLLHLQRSQNYIWRLNSQKCHWQREPPHMSAQDGWIDKYGKSWAELLAESKQLLWYLSLLAWHSILIKESLFYLTMPLEHIDFYIISYLTSNIWSLWYLSYICYICHCRHICNSFQ